MTHMHRDLIGFWKAMRMAEQEKGFNLTVRELCKVWEVESTNTVYSRLDALIRYGFVTTYKTGPKKRIYKTLELDENILQYAKTGV